jgi:predicted metal-dependent phosphoesterase TrpH
VIDLHLHTTASDGRSSPAALVAEAAAAGVTTLAVTDHDTVAGIAEAAAAARDAGLDFVTGIEITAVHASRDVHMLGYFFDPADGPLDAFLQTQRQDRRRRVEEMGARLARLGLPVDLSAALDRRASGKSLGRPLVAAALVAAGHAEDIGDAFARFIGEGRPAFIARSGAPPADVVAIIARAGGVSAIAHPGKLGLDVLIDELAPQGLTAVEVYHPDHSPDDVARYGRMAADRGLLVTGGSDYHGPGSGREGGLGRVSLPPADFARLRDRAAAR